MNMNIEKIKSYYEKFIKLPIQYKILTSILISLLLHLSVSFLFYIGLYHYTSEYGINYQAISSLDITLLSLPFYFDILNSIFGMIIITMAIIVFLLIIEYNFYYKSKNKYSLSYLSKKIYRSMKKDRGLRNFSRNHMILLMNLVFLFIFLSFFALLTIFLEFGIVFHFFTKIFVPFVVAYYIVTNISDISFKILLIFFISFIFISSFNSVRRNGIKEYLIKNSMGGEIPLSLNIQNKFIDGFLVLLTNEKVYFLNKEKTILTMIDRKNVFKMNYFLKIKSKLDANSSMSISATGDNGLKNSRMGRGSFVIADVEYPFSEDNKLDFSKLHY